jgi:hypothetical protein
VVTALILLLTLSYSTLKAIHLAKRSNPLINESKNPSFFDISETLNLYDINFRLAFSFRNYNTKELIDDPKYVKWIVRKRGIRNGDKFEELLPYHKCTDADFDKFYPVSQNSKDELKVTRTDPKKGLFCLDEWTDDLFVGGDEAGKDYQIVEMIMAPCNYVNREFNKTATEDTIAKDCIADLNAQMEYMGPLEMLLYAN